ncbi:MAG: hypothetical protein HFE65_09215 [Clostridiales bacterium]|nr:hypothetical protein [Clostridiales bacterium]
MAENNENKKVTAQELLARLSRPAAQTDAEKSSFASPNSMDPEELLSKFAEKKKQYSEPEEVPEAADPAFDGAFGEKEDLHSEDDFFDNDPVQEEIYLDAEPAEEDPVTYDPATDFESLVNEVTGEETGAIDETDISLMVALGMEDELAKSVGAETAAQMTDDYVADQEEWVTRSKRYGPGEYSDPAENGEIADRYRKRNRWAIGRLLCGLVLTLLILAYENMPLLGYQLSGALDPAVYPVIYIMMDLQLLLLMAVLCYRHIFGGLVSLLKFRPTTDSISAVMTAAVLASSIYEAATVAPGTEPVLFHFPAALCLLFTIIHEFMTVRREIFSFNIVSSSRPKYVMRRLSTRDSMMENEALADSIHDDDGGDIIKIQKTDFVDGYFWRTKNTGGGDRSMIGVTILVALILAAVGGVYAAVSGHESGPFTVAFTVLSASMPAAMIIVGCYPFYRANREAYENDSTIIGEGSVDEYSGTSVVSFDDVNVFPSTNVKVRNVKLYNNSRIDKVLYYAASVFAKTGGPLGDVFEVATMESGYSKDVEILDTGTGYIEAMVGGKHIMFGRAAALAGLGIDIPEDVTAEDEDLLGDCSALYMIYQHKLVAKMIVHYLIDPDFEYILRQLTASGMCVCVKTFDPSIDEDMIYRQIRSGKYSLRVIKYRNTEEITKYSDRADGGIVSRDGTKALLQTISSCDKILSARKTGYVISALAAVLSAVVMAIVLVSGMFSDLHSAYLGAVQLFWLIPAVITTKVIVR